MKFKIGSKVKFNIEGKVAGQLGQWVRVKVADGREYAFVTVKVDECVEVK